MYSNREESANMTDLPSLIEELLPLLEKATDEVDKSLGKNTLLDYISTKLELLLSYCIDVSFYHLLQAEGASAAGHPAIKQLLLLQGVQEKLHPLDVRMKHQLDRLIRLASSSAPALQDQDELDEDSSANLRPRPSLLVAADQGNSLQERDDRQSISEVPSYRAPKISAQPFDEDAKATDKEARRLGRLRTKLRQSETLRSVRSEVLGMPEEVAGGVGGIAGLDDGAAGAVRQQEKEVREWEESHYMRRQVTKKDKRARKKLLMGSSLETIGDLGDIKEMTREYRGSKKKPRR